MQSTRFIESEWIGQGKLYNVAEIPEYVSDEKAKLLSIPAAFEALIPPDNLPVTQFLTLKLPAQSSKFIPVKVKDCFSKQLPRINVRDTLTSRPIPSQKTLRQLEDAVGQAWFDGAKSIMDWRFDDGDKLGFWVLRYWCQMADVIKKQEQWRRSFRYLDIQKTKSHKSVMADILADVENIVYNMAWNSWVSGLRGNACTSQLSSFIGNAWMSSDHIDMMIETLYLCLVNANTTEMIVIAPLVFSTNIWQFARYADRTKLLQHYESAVRSGRLEKLYFPLHVHDSHWICGVINFHERTFTCCDSLSLVYSPPTNFLKDLKTWLRTSFPGQVFKGLNDTLEHGIQQDTYNCGIYAMNAISHAIFGDQILVTERGGNAASSMSTALTSSESNDVEDMKNLSAPPSETDVDNTAVFTCPDLVNLLNPFDMDEGSDNRLSGPYTELGTNEYLSDNDSECITSLV
ncbi:hypothetical protein M378DRAFT_182024 [Amanita muscaria Koide BX008]|uniref:Ubiquitin-like protease family profile domain-containing protein n=1 Tax=Amanita muscaria (strain Koide BX008) TaxID=946122 RepID=A0A0C2SQC1_AMAMK|nr:hypothetical protein M378DRAFT_182024 [Amanita muscaria Koide BX008]